VIFLDSPAGVGYSYTDGARSYLTNDTAAAADTEAFLRGFFERYPELRDLDFYISGGPGRGAAGRCATRRGWTGRGWAGAQLG
jgi:hypothetical protein